MRGGESGEECERDVEIERGESGDGVEGRVERNMEGVWCLRGGESGEECGRGVVFKRRGE